MADDAFFSVVPAIDLANGERLFFDFEGQAIVLFNIAGNYFAIGDVCTHDGGELGDGDLEGFEVICPRHGARFDVRTGQATQMPAVLPTRSYPVRVVDGIVEVKLSEK